MASTHPAAPADAELLEHTAHNPTATDTILLIHGAGVTAADWAAVLPHLSAYHVLAPSLFTAHSLALLSRTSPTHEPTLSALAAALADLLRARAHAGHAHIAGLSFGGLAALHLAAHAPAQCRSVFASGVPRPFANPSATLYPAVRGATLAVQRLVEALPTRWVEGALDGEVRTTPGRWDGQGAYADARLARFVVDGINAGAPRVSGVRRVWLVAATRRSRWVPGGDSVEFAVEVARGVDGAEGADGPACRVFEAPGMFHPWNNQDPALFARCILAAVRGEDVQSDEVREVWHSGME